MADTRFVRDYPALARHRGELRAARRLRQRRLAFAVPLAVLLVAGLFTWSPPAALLCAGVAAMLLFFLSLPASTSVDAGALAGVEGEAATLERLKRLPDDYAILNRVRLPDPRLPNGQRELDFIVTGPTGVWVIEVKNTPGLVQVVGGARHWPLSRRSGCASTPSWNAMENPEPQVRDQVDALSRWLLMNGVSVEPRGVICLAHPEVAIRDADAASYPVVVPEQLPGRISGARAGRSIERRGAIPAGMQPLIEQLAGGTDRPSKTASSATTLTPRGARSASDR